MLAVVVEDRHSDRSDDNQCDRDDKAATRARSCQIVGGGGLGGFSNAHQSNSARYTFPSSEV